MKHLCDVEMAKLIGTDPSLFLENIAFWIKHNYSNDTNYHEGRYWTFNTQEALVDFFPYWSRDQIKRIIKKCHDAGMLVKGNFNKLSYDRTTWFSLSDEAHKHYGLNLGRNSLRHQAKSPVSLDDIAQPIPDINHIQTQIRSKDKAQRKKRVDAVIVEPIVLPDWLDKESWNNFIQHRKEIGKPLKTTGIKMAIKKLERMKEQGQDIVLVIEHAISNGYQGLFEIKSQGESNGKDSKYYGANGKFDSMQYLLDSIREDEERKLRESKENNCLPESELPLEDSKYIQYDGTSVFGY
jgi:hypothetical protein